MSSKQRMLTALAIVVAVMTAGCGTRQTNDDDTSSQQTMPTPSQTMSTEVVKPTTTPSSGPATLAPDNVQFLEAGLVSSNKTEQALTLVPELRKGNWPSSAVPPPGSTLTIDQKSFLVAGNGYATVNATVVGSVRGEFVLHLAFAGGKWLIYRTEQKR